MQISLMDRQAKHNTTCPDIALHAMSGRRVSAAVDAFAAANDVQCNDRRFAFEYFSQFGNRAHAFAIEANNDIVLMQAGLRGRAAFIDVINDDAFGPILHLTVA